MRFARGIGLIMDVWGSKYTYSQCTRSDLWLLSARLLTHEKVENHDMSHDNQMNAQAGPA